MSDPVTHAEIEDVLSSIRRLVSEDGRPPEAAGKPAGRLVLTPALRVRERPEPPAGGAAETPADPSDAEAGGETALERLAGPDCLQLRLADRIRVPDAAAQADMHAEAGAADAGETGAGTLPDAAPQEAPGAASPGVPWADPQATLFSAAAAAPRINGGAETAGGRAASVLQKIAELEAKVARSPGDWEPDGVPQDAFSGTANGTIAWQDEPDPEPQQAETAGPAASGNGPDRDLPDDLNMAAAALADTALERLPPETAYHDEDSLRELVSAIVREELQGALGERITRNIRKLVRREIHRVLATQDLL